MDEGQLRSATPRRAMAYALPTLLLLGWVIFPLVRGSDTLFLRDIFIIHLPMKQVQAEAMRAGHLPLIDPTRAGGQPLIGNLNGAPLYPDNLFYLLGKGLPATQWALNAHFWLHWLLAPLGFFALARAWGLSRSSAWAGGVFWATGGFYLSQLNLYNMVAGVTVAPAFVAAALGLTGPRRWASAAALGALWALLLLGGEPFVALCALLAAAGALSLRLAQRWSLSYARQLAWPLTLGLGAGTIAALPQLVELARIVGTSFRGTYGVSGQAATAGSFHPLQIVDVLLPMPFGRIDLLGPGGYWVRESFGFSLILALYPGILALGLAVASGRPRRGESSTETPWALALPWAWGVIGLGLFLAMGRTNPIGPWLFSTLGVRYPGKAWLLVALGLTVLATIGLERAFVRGEDRPARRAVLAVAVLAGLQLAAGFGLRFAGASFTPWLAARMSAEFKAYADFERQRLEDLALNTGAVGAGLVLLIGLARRRPSPHRACEWSAAAVALHAASQLFWLRPLFGTDATLPYRLPTPVAEIIPAQSVVAHGSFYALFGPSRYEDGIFPEAKSLWLTRRGLYELYPAAGQLIGRRYAFNPSAEGLDSFWAELAQAAVKNSKDPERMKLLQAIGADRAVLDRPLSLEGMPAGFRLAATLPTSGRLLYIYALDRTLPEAQLFGRVSRVDMPSGFYRRMTDPNFDPATEAVTLADGEALDGPGGTVELELNEAERVLAKVDSPRGGVLVLKRAHLPLYRVWVDGERVEPVVTNLQLLGVPVPPGPHRVEVATDRRPLAWTIPLSLLAWSSLVLLALRSRATRVDSPTHA